MASIRSLVHSGATGRKPAASDPRSMTLPAKTGSVCLCAVYPDVDAAMASPIVSAASGERFMRRPGFNVAPRLAALMLAVACAAPAPAFADQTPNRTPLTFGMDPDEASRALGTPLNYVSGSPGNEMYLALPNVEGSALSFRKDGLYLQFRKGRLMGWKGDWRTNRP
jgi:hypothetical protein